ncbi:MAG: RDD family protein [Acidobacteria bacterium]|nr:MAG: RDD family protein [Acidobacteriota bacterium]
MANESSPATVLGLDNVRLQLPLAGVGSRVLAALIDYVLLGLLVLTWWLAGLMLVGSLGLGIGWTVAILVLGSFLLQWGYFAALEILTRGQTLGKQAIGLRVASRRGGQADAGAIVIRNLLRTVDVVFGVPMLLFDPQSRRLGDLLAGTLVVHEPAAGEEPRLGRLPAGWGARQAAVVEGFLRRAAYLERRHAERLARRILDAIRRDDPELAGGAPAGDPVDALRAVLQVGEG